MGIDNKEDKRRLELHKLWLVEYDVGQRANFSHRQDLDDADFSGMDLRNADLRGANLRGADLRGANLQDANLRGADLQGADLQGVNLRGADLRNADLRGANLREADLQGANLRGANLQGANLQGADLDMSSGLPLWCGGLKAKLDEKLIIQELYHLMSHIKHAEGLSDDLKKTLWTEETVDLANRFHRPDVDILKF